MVVGGEFESELDFGDGPFTAPGSETVGFLGKLRASDGSGKMADGGWGRPFCYGSASCAVTGISMVAMDDILVSGTFDGTLQLDLGDYLYAEGTQDASVAKLTDTGGVLWQQQIGGPGSAGDA